MTLADRISHNGRTKPACKHRCFYLAKSPASRLPCRKRELIHPAGIGSSTADPDWLMNSNKAGIQFMYSAGQAGVSEVLVEI